MQCQGESLLVNEKEAARLLSVSPAALRVWRREKKGPEAVRLGRAVRYSRDSLIAYIVRCAEGEKD